ncbi:MAG: right-handed parallel beta-helix repeat-containing protein [Phycisphaerales bacterium]
MQHATPTNVARALRVAIAVSVLTAPAAATVRYVAACGNDGWAGTSINCLAPGGPKKTVQATINGASDGDTIIVLAGTYVGAIDFDGKSVTLVSASGAAFTVLTRNDAGPIVTCNSAEGVDTVLQGFTLRDGYTASKGAGLRCVLSEPTIIDCVFDGNVALDGGAAASLLLASPSFLGCTFTDNMNILPIPDVRGGAVLVEQGHPTFSNCAFVNNRAADLGGAVAIVDGAADFDGCDFSGNGLWDAQQSAIGAAIGCDGGAIELDDCTFIGNDSAGQGGGVGLLDADADIALCTFQANTAKFFHGGAVQAMDSTVNVLGCAFDDNRSNGYGAALTAVFCNVSIALSGFHDNGLAGPGGIGPSSRGGAVWVSYCDTTIGASTFGGNGSDVDGGAITVGGYPYDTYATTISGCTFTGNSTAGDGGAVSVSNGNCSITDSTFSQNTAQFGGAIHGDRGTDGPEFPPSHIAIAGCTFSSNSAFTGGGIVLASDGDVTGCDFLDNTASWVAGALSIVLPAQAVASDSLFQGNTALSGGAVSAGSSGCAVIGCTFTENSATTGGALISTIAGETPRVFNSLFMNNQADDGGAAVGVGGGGNLVVVNSVIHHNTTAATRSAVWVDFGQLSLANCTIANNVGGGILVDPAPASASIRNCIVWGNTSGAQIAGASASVRYSDVQGGAIGKGNIDVTPKFVGALGGNYRLLPTSACIDAGMNWLAGIDAADLDDDGVVNELTPIDFDGNPRFANAAAPDTGCGLGAIVDLGAFESRGAAIGNAIFADLDGDGAVNATDLAMLLGMWGGASCLGDFDGDGTVGAADLALLLGAWTG